MQAKKLYIGLGVGAMVLAAAGGVGYTMYSPTPAPAPQAPTTTPASAEVKVAAPPEVPAVEFAATTEAAVVKATTAAYLAPNPDAPQFYPLQVGTKIQGSEKSTDGKWLLALTADGQAAFIPTKDLEPYSAPLPETVSGAAQVVDTATLVIGGQQISQASVTGEAGTYAQQLQELIDAKGHKLNCKRQTTAYVCDLHGIGDIARMALFNGAARPAPDASEDYRQQADAAKAAHKGIWATVQVK